MCPSSWWMFFRILDIQCIHTIKDMLPQNIGYGHIQFIIAMLEITYGVAKDPSPNLSTSSEELPSICIGTFSDVSLATTQDVCVEFVTKSAGIYLFKVNYGNTKKRPEWHNWHYSGVFIIKCEQISRIVLEWPFADFKQVNAGWNHFQIKKNEIQSFLTCCSFVLPLFTRMFLIFLC